MIVNGFCKEVFKELPMEFAVEAQKLLGVSLEGSVGLNLSLPKDFELDASAERMSKQPILEIKNLSAGVEGKQILKGVNLDDSSRRSPRRHGPERQRQEHARRVLAGREGYDVTGGEVLYTARICSNSIPKNGRAKGCSSRFSIRSKSPA